MIKNKNMTTLSQALRSEATKEENTLWYRFLRHYPIQFRRQCVFGKYIVDLYCAKALLVVELDGSQHYDPQEMQKDAERTRHLESLGLKVLRFSNADIHQHFDRVCEAIDSAVKERCSQGPQSFDAGRRAFTTIKNQGSTPLIRPFGAPSPRGKVLLHHQPLEVL